MDDDQILMRGGTEEDIKEYSKQNGADFAMDPIRGISFQGRADNVQALIERFGREEYINSEKMSLEKFINTIAPKI